LKVKRNDGGLNSNIKVSGVILSAAWSKKPMLCLADLKSGVMSDACIFQAVLGASKMPYMKAFPRKEQKYWVQGLIDSIEYYDGLPALIAPRAHNTPKISEYLSPLKDSAFEMFSSFYGIPVLPVNLEGLPLNPDLDLLESVNWILRQLHDRVFYSLDELNANISLLLSQYVTLPSSALRDSRFNVFYIKDKPLMKPLPQQRFSIVDISTRVVGDNCFVKYCGSYYSVPYMFCGQEVILYASESEIVIYGINGVYLTSHKRDGETKYTMEPSHMPPKYKLFGYPVYDGGKYVEWAAHIGDNTRSIIECLLASADYEQLAFKTCMAILQLSKKYGNYRLESACKAAKILGCISCHAIKKLITQDTQSKAVPTKAIYNDYIQLPLDTDNNL